MARNRRKKSLYEVISRARPKPSYAKTLQQVYPEKSGKEEPVVTEAPDVVTRWRKRPRIVQFNAGRVEISMPYQLAIALVLGIILLALIAFRLGQITYLNKPEAVNSAIEMPKSPPKAAGEVTTSRTRAPETVSSAQKTPDVPVKAKGDHRIVIKQYYRSRDLEPLQGYFAANGIETEIQKRSIGYFLVTKNTYGNPERAGTDGYAAKQEIIRIGGRYKAPPGYERFAPKLFSDAYGEKIR